MVEVTTLNAGVIATDQALGGSRSSLSIASRPCISSLLRMPSAQAAAMPGVLGLPEVGVEPFAQVIESAASHLATD